MKKLIIHLTGTVCSGKSTVIKELSNPIICSWDIADWYRENNIIIDNEFIFDNYIAKRHLIWRDFKRFAIQNKNCKIFILESSGSNKEINSQLDKIRENKTADIVTIRMQPPSINEIKERVKQRKDITEAKALDMLELYNKTRIQEEELTFEETYFYLKCLGESYANSSDSGNNK